MLQDRLNMAQHPLPYTYQPLEEEWRSLRRSTPKDFEKSPETGVSQETVDKVAEVLTTVPQGFKPIKRLRNS